MSDSFQPYRPVAHQAPLSLGFSRQEYWRGLPCPSPGDLPGPGISNQCLLCLLHWQAGSLPLASPGKPQINQYSILKNKSVGMQFRAGMDCHLHKVHSHPDTGFLLVHRFAVSQVWNLFLLSMKHVTSRQQTGRKDQKKQEEEISNGKMPNIF